MTGLLESLTRAVEGSFGIAFTAAFLWGVASIVLSPCHLSGVPLVVAFLSNGRGRKYKPYGVSAVFGLGLLASIAVVGVATAAAGRVLGDLGNWTNWMVAAVLAFVGLFLLDGVKLNFSSPNIGRFNLEGYSGAGIAGLVFGLAIGPCTFAFLAPVLGAGFKTGAGNWVTGAALVAAFGLGECLTVSLAGGSIGLVQNYLGNRQAQTGVLWFRRVLGLIAVVAALYYVYKAA